MKSNSDIINLTHIKSKNKRLLVFHNYRGISNLSFSVLVLFFFFTRCANPVSPTGGPKDIEPPFMVKSEPEQYSTQFNDQTIRITFNEFVKLSDLNKTLVISPPLKNQPEIIIRKKTMMVKFTEDLKDSTTYNLFFGDAIGDITENNKTTNFSFVFSTGSYVDSLTVKGSAINAFDNKPASQILIMLYDVGNDSINTDTIPRKVRPFYLAKTDADGKFRLSNISNRKYLVFALHDQNANFLFDLPDEEIGFLDTLVMPVPSEVFKHVNDTSKKDTLISLASFFTEPVIKMFKEQDSTQKLIKSRTAGTAHYNMVFKKPLSDPEIRFITPGIESGKIYTEFNTARDTLNIWLNQNFNETASLFFSDPGEIEDTIRFMPYNPPKEDKKVKIPSKIEHFKTNIKGAKLPLNDTLKIRFDVPVTRIDTSKILFTGGGDTLTQYSARIKDTLSRDVIMTYPWKKDVLYSVVLFPSSITGFNNFTNDTIELSFKKRPVEETGNILVVVDRENVDAGLILQIINKDGLVAREKRITESGKVIFNNLEPGAWFIKAIIDKNQNGKWDTGNYKLKLQPEQVIIFPKELNLRSNWDIEENWMINPGN